MPECEVWEEVEARPQAYRRLNDVDEMPTDVLIGP